MDSSQEYEPMTNSIGDTPPRADATTAITLGELLDEYCRSNALKPKTVKNYRQRILGHLKDWLDLDVRKITKNMVQDRHREIGKIHPAQANSTMRTLRALLYYASYRFEDENGTALLPVNPVRRLTEIRGWYKDRRRRDVIRLEQIGDWMSAVHSIDNGTIRDLLLLLLFTGMRFGECQNLRWSQVNLKIGTISLSPEDTKTSQAIEIPLNTFAWRLLGKRLVGARSAYVFPCPFDIRQPISNNTKSYQHVRTRSASSGVSFSYHTLRRTFLSIADELDVKQEVCKQLVNHSTRDVTEGYIVRSIERLRRASQAVCDAILKHAPAGIS
jgi:integrase